uniref:Fibronectin type-III domain-containing protein n=1 Tax=Amphimedon queenslandica TaxID=400682 RepID=A0A1X7SGP7_AMPQE
GVYGAEIAYLITNYLVTTLSTAPTAPVGDIIFSSVESVSMTVSWDEVPCNGRNGPITGYYLTYTNITSNTSYTVNITGGDNRMYNFTGLIPYTNYTVSIILYNYNMNGPARQEIQSTPDESKPSIATDLTSATILASSTISYSTETTTMTTALTIPLATPLATVSTTVLVKNGGTITGWIVGVTVLASLLAVSVIIILVLVVYIKRANIKQKSSLQFHRKPDKEIEMECSPAYTTNTADDLSMKDSPTYMYATVQEAQSTDEPIYDTAGPESIY